MGVSEALTIALQVVVIALVVGILQKIGTTAIAAFGYDFVPLIGLVLGLSLLWALIESVVGLVGKVREIATEVKGRSQE